MGHKAPLNPKKYYRLNKKPQKYYHLTQKNLGVTPTLKPRATGENRGDSEPLTPRICVSSTVSGCLVALGSCLDKDIPIQVYQTKNEVVATYPEDVFDAKLTGEMWLVGPTKFELVGVVDERLLPEDLFDIFQCDFTTKQSRTIQKRVLEELQGLEDELVK